MKIKPKGKIYSINEGYATLWQEPVKKYIESRKVLQCRLRFVLIPLLVSVHVIDVLDLPFLYYFRLVQIHIAIAF